MGNFIESHSIVLPADCFEIFLDRQGDGWRSRGGGVSLENLVFQEKHILSDTANEKKKIFYNQVEEVKKDTSSKEFLKINDDICKVELGSDLIFTFILMLAPSGT